MRVSRKSAVIPTVSSALTLVDRLPPGWEVTHVTCKDAAALISVYPSSILKAVHRGVLPAIKLSLGVRSPILIRRQDLREYVESHPGGGKPGRRNGTELTWRSQPV